jgi:predicted nucleotidyltransferase
MVPDGYSEAPMNTLAISLPRDELAQFCHRWKIRELALFGSVVRDDFTPESDVDILVTFADNVEWGLLDHIKMQQELETLLQRKVDLISKRAVEQSLNWIRRDAILRSARVLITA